jgi:acyl-coenzyme A thioesterase PaaI-like protein
MSPANPHFRERIEQRLTMPLIADFFRMYAVAIEPGAVTIALDHRLELGHEPGWFQGSVTTAIAEFAAGFSGQSLLAPDWAAVTLDQHINFVGTARGERLVARGRVIMAGRTISTCAAEVFVVRDGAEHLCATMVQTNRNAPLPPARP